jgi:hypothetical protein
MGLLFNGAIITETRPAIKEAISAISCSLCASRVRLREGNGVGGMENVEWQMLNCGVVKEIAMKKSRCSWLFVVGLLAVVGLFGCSQETPVEKTKAAAASGNAATQAAGQAAVDAIKTPMDKARQTESVLEQSAEQTAAKIKEATQ